MAFLLCSYASQRSSREKIERWVSELIQLRDEHGDNPQRLQSIEILLNKAQRWLEPNYRSQAGRPAMEQP